MNQEKHTNGAEKSETDGGARFPQHLTDAGRQIRGDAQNLVTHVSEASSELQSYVTEVARERPLAILAAAAGVGYVLGGGLSSRLTVLALGVGTRLAMALAAREVSSWAAQPIGDSRSPQQLSGRRQQSGSQQQGKGGSEQSGGSGQTH